MSCGPSDPRFWQERYESGETRWDKGAPAPPLVSFLKDRAVVGRVLVPGCGSGHDVRALSEQGAEVTGLDFAAGAIDAARAIRPVGSESYVLEDFLNCPGMLKGGFDWIFEHTCFCAIEPSRRRDYVKACIHCLRPGGRLLAVFYLETGDPPDVGPPFATDREEILSLFGSYFEVEQEGIPKDAYPGREGKEWLWMGRLI